MSKSLNGNDASAFLDSLLQLALGDRLFRIHTCYNVTVSSSWRIDERVLDEIHMLYVRSGRVIYTVDGQPLELTAGNVLILTDGTLHSAYRDPSEPLSIIPFRFKIVRYEDDTGEFLRTANPVYFSFLPGHTQKFLHLFETVHRHYVLPPSVRRDALCHAAICRLLAEIAGELEELEQGKPVHAAIQHIKHYIDTNPADRSSVRELAAQSGLTAKYCSQLFQQLFGLPIKEYQIKARIEYAHYLLEHSEQSVKEIAFHLGYPDPFTFSKQYKAVTGMSPSEVLRDGRL